MKALRIFLLFIIILLQSSALFAQWDEEGQDYMPDSLYRVGVRAVKITEGVELEMSMSIVQNDTGLFVESKINSNSLTSHSTKQYNKRNLVVKSTSEMGSFAAIPKHTVLYKYANNDSILEKRTIYGDGLKATKLFPNEIVQKYSYDSSWRLIQVDQFADSKLKLTYTLRYNDRGQLIERKQMLGPASNDTDPMYAGEKVRKEVFSYDSLKRLIDYRMFADDSLSESTAYSFIEGICRVTTVKSSPSWLESKTSVTAFDSTGKEIEEVKYGEDNMLTSLTLKRYNVKGKLDKEIIYSKGLLSSWAETLYFYDANDNIVRKEMRGKDEPLVDLYEHDSRGNIIQETSMLGDKVLNTRKYTYTYAK